MQTHRVPATPSHGGGLSTFPLPPEPPAPARASARTARGHSLQPGSAVSSPGASVSLPLLPGERKNTPSNLSLRQGSPLVRRSCRPLTPLGVPWAFAPPRPRCLRGPRRSARSTAGSAVSPECIPHVASIKDFCHAILRLTDFRCFSCGLRNGDLLLLENRGGRGGEVWEPPLLAFSHLSDCLQLLNNLFYRSDKSCENRKREVYIKPLSLFLGRICVASVK